MDPSRRPTARVLVVEDHEPLRRSLERTLADRYPEVRSCATCREAIALIASYRPDLILLDLVLLDGTGLDVARAAARSLPDARLVAMSGTASERAFEELAAHGIVHHVRKPLTAASLDRVLARVAEGAPPVPASPGQVSGTPVSASRSRRARVLDWLRGRHP